MVESRTVLQYRPASVFLFCEGDHGMFATVFNGWDIVDLTADWESALWLCNRLNAITTLSAEGGSDIYQIRWVD